MSIQQLVSSSTDIPSYQEEIDFAEYRAPKEEPSLEMCEMFGHKLDHFASYSDEDYCEYLARKYGSPEEVKPHADTAYTQSDLTEAIKFAVAFLPVDSDIEKAVIEKIDSSSQKSSKRIGSSKSRFSVASDSYSLRC